MIKVSEEDVINRVKKEYPPEDVDEVLTILGEYGRDEYESSPEFMRLAILRLANRNKQKLSGLVKTTKWDYRDVLGGVQYQYGLDWLGKYLGE
jgi:hypothetical protein